tara:strand:- start:1706 stop:3964 length:2259 start_codon:yes stop_codon:yes gene_type:complete
LKKSFLNIGLLILVILIVVSNAELSTAKLESKKKISDNQIEDLIPALCGGISYSELKDLKPDDIKLIDVKIPNSANWYRNFYNAYLYSTEKGNYINEVFKKDFNAVINLEYSNQKKCNYKAEVRINGDLKDHLDVNNLIASLDVKLEEGNIFGITRFKLLIPETRRGDEEIFATTILNHLGFLSPRSFYVNASLNGNQSYIFIFQEKLVKEMLEYNGYREGPVLETNEEYVWNSDKDSFYRSDDLFDKPAVEIGRIVNTRWANSSKENKIISIEALEAFNKSLIQTTNNRQLNNEMLGLDVGHIYVFEAANRALVANHNVTVNHNRQMFYNKLSNEFIPSYYDGNPEFFTNPPFEDVDYLNIQLLSEGAKKALEIPIDINKLTTELNLNGLPFSEEEVANYINVFKSNLDIVKSYPKGSKLKHPTFNEQKNDRRDTSMQLLFFNFDSDESYICNQYLENCRDILVHEDINLFNKKISIDGLPAHLFATDKEKIINPESTLIDSKSFETIDIDDLIVRNYNNVNIDLDLMNKTITFYIDKKDQKILVTSDNVLVDWSFIVKNSYVGEELYSRSDRNLLTGCLTFYDVELQNINIYSDSSHCEDNVNLINVDGRISYLNIVNSLNDALDIDSSNLYIEEIYINNAGNDCLDLSYGGYVLNKLELINCGDKGTSIGESSAVKISSINILNSKTAVAVKDSSDVEIGNFNGMEAGTCVQLYRKKQEFGPSRLKILNYSCESENINYIQIGSEYEEN